MNLFTVTFLEVCLHYNIVSLKMIIQSIIFVVPGFRDSNINFFHKNLSYEFQTIYTYKVT